MASQYLRDRRGRLRAEQLLKTVARLAQKREQLKRSGNPVERARGIVLTDEELTTYMRLLVTSRIWPVVVIASLAALVALWLGADWEQAAEVLEWIVR